ncbi:MAG: RNA-binding protein [Niastella sp.]|nr:RNA-binding protein [Niastella sp.]
MNIYVSNLGLSVQADDLKKLFSTYGIVISVALILDKITNRSRGFAFVDMPETGEAEKAIHGLNGLMLEGRLIKVSESRSRGNDASRSNFY